MEKTIVKLFEEISLDRPKLTALKITILDNSIWLVTIYICIRHVRKYSKIKTL